jgi:hypothetical protein
LPPSPSDPSARPKGSPWIIVGLIALLVVIRQLCRARFRRPAFDMYLIIFVLALALGGCGGGGYTTNPPPYTGTPKGAYTFSVTGSSGTGSTNTTISTQVTVTVQ